MAYSLRMSRQAGGFLKLYSRLRHRNTCKTCALGMGGQKGGMVNEAGHFPEICKKSIQAQAGDMQAPISPEQLEQHPLSRLETFTSLQLERMGRIGFPIVVRKGGTHFSRIPWKEALSIAGSAFREALPHEVFFYSSGRSSNEAAFLMQLVARAYGTGNINNCSCYCHNASGVALADVYGSGTASVVLGDLERADLVLIAGANPPSNHPRLMTQLVNLKRRGGTVIVVNPLRELGLVRFRVPSDWSSMLFGSPIADLYLQPHVGSDVALFKALLKGVLEKGGVEDSYVRSYTSGWEGVRMDVEQTSWEELCHICGVSRREIESAVDLLVGAQRGIFCWAMGLTHHSNGVDNVFELANLALARGWLGQPGCGLMPIRGHSNVQGVGSVGVAPALKASFQEKLESLYGLSPIPAPGMDTFRSMEAAAEGRIQSAFLLGGNLLASNPDRTWAAAALGKIRTTVHVSTKLNEGHVHGRSQTVLILPALARDEEIQTTSQESMFNLVRLSSGGSPAHSTEMRSEVEIIASLAERILPADRFDWSQLRSHEGLRQAISKTVPGYEAIGMIDKPEGGEFQIGGRTFHRPVFETPDGKAHFHPTPLPDFTMKDREFRMMTVRSEGQFNTVVYEDEDLYRGNSRRDVVMMAEADAERFRLEEGTRVRVITDAGKMEVAVAIIDIRPGNLAMYYPEANMLVPKRIDSRSGTPAFKSVVARIELA